MQHFPRLLGADGRDGNSQAKEQKKNTNRAPRRGYGKVSQGPPTGQQGKHCGNLRGGGAKVKSVTGEGKNVPPDTLRGRVRPIPQEGLMMEVYTRQTIVKYGVGFGSALAMAVSFTLNKSILWAIIHGILGWIYVVYAWLFKTY
jgi:hypothetical protein